MFTDDLNETPLDLTVKSVSSTPPNPICDRNRFNGRQTNTNLRQTQQCNASTSATNSMSNNISLVRRLNKGQDFEHFLKSIWMPQIGAVGPSSSNTGNSSFCDANNNQVVSSTVPKLATKRKAFGRSVTKSKKQRNDSPTRLMLPAQYQFPSAPIPDNVSMQTDAPLPANYASARLRMLLQRVKGDTGRERMAQTEVTQTFFPPTNAIETEFAEEASQSILHSATLQTDANGLGGLPCPATESTSQKSHDTEVLQNMQTIPKQMNSAFGQLQKLSQPTVQATNEATDVPSPQPEISIPVASSPHSDLLPDPTVNIHGIDYFICPFSKCRQVLLKRQQLDYHRRSHMGIKPYLCKWPDCPVRSAQKSNLTKHIRRQHFDLPETFKEQNDKKIIDNRDAELFIEVDQELLNMAKVANVSEAEKLIESSQAILEHFLYLNGHFQDKQ